jgi:hypothetical protein
LIGIEQLGFIDPEGRLDAAIETRADGHKNGA